MVPVATRDEFGLIAGHTNTMIAGLRHRIALISALKLAEEVQRTLLPAGAAAGRRGWTRPERASTATKPAGTTTTTFCCPRDGWGSWSRTCPATASTRRSSWPSARAFMLSEAQGFSSPSELARDVNRHVARDSAPTGRFMSMFFLEIDPAARTLRWVRAGHEPALMYDPVATGFPRTRRGRHGAGGGGGVWRTSDYTLTGWAAGAVIVIGTDGITETRSPTGELFGAARVREIVRANAHLPADGIQAAVIRAVQEFRGDAPQEDDLTLVVLKLA